MTFVPTFSADMQRLPAARRPDAAKPAANPNGAVEFAKAWLALPFDTVRAQYAGAVQAGLLERSLLASGRVEHALAGIETLLLGSWARRV